MLGHNIQQILILRTYK